MTEPELIPEFWLAPAVCIFIVVLLSAMTGGTPTMIITPRGIHYGIEHD